MGVSVTGPTTVGVMVNVCAVEEFKNVRVVAVETPPPDGAIVIEPLYSPFGVTVKFVETEFNAPPVGPLKVYVPAEAAGATMLPGKFLDFLDPWGNCIEVVEYSNVQFTKAPQVLRGMQLELAKNETARRELAEKGLGE